MSRKNILIAGAPGFVGRALTQKLSKTNNNIYLTSRNKKFTHAGVKKIYYGDLVDPKFCKKILNNINIVYYLAGCKKNIFWHQKTPYTFSVDNLKPLLTFLEEFKQCHSASQLIYISTVNINYVHQEISQRIYDGYGMGKYINEIAIRAFMSEYPKFNIKIIRPIHIYGPGDKFDSVNSIFLPAIIDRVAKSKNELIVWGKGIRKMQFIYIDDFIDNLIAISKEKKRDLFTIGNPEVKTINQISKMVIQSFGKKLIIKHNLAKPDKPTKLFKFDNPLKPKVNLEQGLKRTIDFYQKNINPS